MQYVANIFDIVVYGLIGALAAYFYFEWKKRELLGGFWGGAVIGTVGAVLITQLASIDAWFTRLVTLLMNPVVQIGEVSILRLNFLTAIIGSFLFVYILNRINHDKPRKR